MASSHRTGGSLLEEDSEYAKVMKLREQLNAAAKDAWQAGGDALEKFLRENAAIISETIYRSFESENVLQLLSTLQRNVGKFDRVTIREARGLRARWFARGGYIRASQMWQDVVELPRAIVGFHVYESTDKFEAQFAEMQGDLIGLGTKRMDAAVNQYAFAAFQAAIPDDDDNYHSAAGVDLDTLDAALSAVFDLTEEQNVTIVGRRPMVEQIRDQLVNVTSGSSLFTPETNEQILKFGILGTYKGATILQARNYRDENEVPFIPANEMWVVGRDNSTSAFFGGLESKEYVEDDDWYWHYLAKREFGLMVHRKSRLHRIVDSEIDPTQGSGDSYVDA